MSIARRTFDIHHVMVANCSNAGAWARFVRVAEATKQLTIKLIQKQVEAAGFADVQVSPEVHVVKAKDKDGKQIVLVVDPRTMTAIPLVLPEAGTTGSGSEDEGEEKL